MNQQPDSLKQALDHALQDIQWTEENRLTVHRAIQQKGTIPMKRTFTKTLILAAVILSLTVGALAATGVIFSDRIMQQIDADKVLSNQYGLTAEMLTYFTRETDGGIVTYSPRHGYEYVLGTYTVTMGDAPTASWSWDGTEPSADMNGAPWGAQALGEIISCLHTTHNSDEISALALALTATAGTQMDEGEDAPDNRLSDFDFASNWIKAATRQTIDTETLTATGRAAICAAYGITPEMEPHLSHIPENNIFLMTDEGTPCLSLYFSFSEWAYGENKPATDRFQEWQSWEGIYTVGVNVETGVVETIDYISTVIYGNG